MKPAEFVIFASAYAPALGVIGLRLMFGSSPDSEIPFAIRVAVGFAVIVAAAVLLVLFRESLVKRYNLAVPPNEIGAQSRLQREWLTECEPQAISFVTSTVPAFLSPIISYGDVAVLVSYIAMLAVLHAQIGLYAWNPLIAALGWRLYRVADPTGGPMFGHLFLYGGILTNHSLKYARQRVAPGDQKGGVWVARSQ